MTRMTKKDLGLASGLLLGVAASAIMALPASVMAQGWTAELSDVVKNPPPSSQKRAKPAAAPKTKTRPEAAKSAARDLAKPQPTNAPSSKPDAAKPEPVKAETTKGEPVEAEAAKPVPGTVPATAIEPVKAEPIPLRAVEPENAEADGRQTASEPAVAQPDVTGNATADNGIANPDAEPDDPFADLKVMPRSGDSETLTTQVVPGENRAPTEAVPSAERGPASQYCTNIADAAIDARIAWQRQNLAEVEKEVQKRTTELEVKTAEYQRWLTRRDQFAERAQKAIVDIYSKMKPDAAALQLQALDDETAAAVLIKLDARVASSVMNEMEPVQAARLTSILSGAAKGPGSRSRPAPPAGNRS